MSDQKQIERVCKAMGIEGTLPRCSTFDIDIPAKVIYPTGSALLEALKARLNEGEERSWIINYDKSQASPYEVIIFPAVGESRGKSIGDAITELDALLAACEQAFCKKT